MKNPGLIVLAAVGVAAAISLLPSPHPALAAGAGPEDDAKTLMKLDEEWSSAAGKRDVERVASFYATSANAYPPNEPLAVGRDAAKAVWAAYFAEPSFNISWNCTHAEVAKSGDIGYTTGAYQDSYKTPDGKLVKEKGKYLCVWKKQTDGSWKAIQDMWNSDSK